MNSRTLYIYIILLFFNLTVRGQVNSDSLIASTLDSVIINAARYSIPLNSAPFSIKSIEKINLEHHNSLKEVMQTTSGIIINNRHNYSQGDKILLRGIGTRSAFGVRGVRIFLDGIPLTFTDGQSQLNNLDIENIEKIEIVKGPSSTLYGNSLGGAILLESYIKKQDFVIEPEVTLGSYGFKKYNLRSAGSIFNGNYSINLYSAESNGFREHSQSKFYGLSLILKNEIFENTFLSLVSNYYYAPYLLNPSSLNKDVAERNPASVRNSVKNFTTGKKIAQFQNGLSLHYNFNSNSKIKSTIYTVSRSLKNSIPGRIIELERIFGGMRVEFESKFNFLNSKLFSLIGIDYEMQLDRRKEFENGGNADYEQFDPRKLFKDITYNGILIHQNENVKSLGVFSHINYKLTKDLTLFGGFRFDDYFFEVEEKLAGNNSSNLSMDNFSEMIGFSYKLQSNITLFGNYSNGFQTPTTNELSNNPLREGGFNNNLSPEVINNYELGIRGWWFTPNIYTNISLYTMNISDMLIAYQSESEESFYRNAGSAKNIGFEIEFEIQPINNIRVFSSYTFMDFRFADYKIAEEINGVEKELQLAEKFLSGIPKNYLSLSVLNKFPYGISAKLSYNWSDQYFTNDFNGPISGENNSLRNFVNDAYSVFNFNISFSQKLNFGILNISLNIDNLLDSRFNDSIVPNAFGDNFFEPAPRRTFYVNTSLVF